MAYHAFKQRVEYSINLCHYPPLDFFVVKPHWKPGWEHAPGAGDMSLNLNAA